MSQDSKQKSKKVIKCVVVSDAMDKSRIGKIDRKVKHKIYKKYIKCTTRVMFHDQENLTKVGDFVGIFESRHYSKKKKFKLAGILNK